MTKQIKEALIGVGFLVMLIGCAGADSSLTFAAVLIAIGCVLVLLGKSGLEECNEKGCMEGSHHNSDHRVVDFIRYRNRKR